MSYPPSMSSSLLVLAKPTASVIFLHGLGDTGHGWAAAFQQQRLPYVKYIFPTASTIPVTLSAGFRMPSWFDLKSLSLDGPEDEDGIQKATEKIHQLIADEEAIGIPSTRIVLGGFSQGGALAIYSALRYSKPLAGVIALSCWLPLYGQFPGAAIGNNTDVPLMQCHGDSDPIVPYQWGKMTHELLQSFMSNVNFKTFANLGHSSSDEEMRFVKDFINEVIPP